MIAFPNPRFHGHFWIVALIGVAAGLLFLIWAPRQPAISGSLFLFAGFHLLGGIVVVASLWQLAPSRGRGAVKRGVDFGSSGRRSSMLLIAALAALGAGGLAGTLFPGAWPVAGLLLLQGLGFICGYFVSNDAGHDDAVVLPLFDLPSSSDDAGLIVACGAGRATISLAREWRAGPLVAMDSFKTDQRERLYRNLTLTGLDARVEIADGAVCAAPFPDRAFSLVVGAHVYDHQRGREPEALREAHRLLRDDGRLLATLWTPSWALFSVVSLAAFSFRRKAVWRRRLRDAGFAIVREFRINYGWGVIARKA